MIQGKLGERAVERWNWVKANIDGLKSVGISEKLGSPPIFGDDIKFKPLQAADMFAWLVRDVLTKRGQVEDISRAAIRHLEDRKIVRSHITQDMIMALGANFMVGKARVNGHL